MKFSRCRTNSSLASVATLLTLCRVIEAIDTSATYRDDNDFKEILRGSLQFREPSTRAPAAIAVAGFLDFEDQVACASNMVLADEDQNNSLDYEEYAKFVEFQSNGVIRGSYQDLDLRFSMLFASTACTTCFELTDDDKCCLGDAANIPIGSLGDLSDQFVGILTFLCPVVNKYVAQVESERRPPTESPTQTPTVTPTLAVPDETSAPSDSPSDVPSTSPTQLPSDVPSDIPTFLPTTSSPTTITEGTVVPSQQPSDMPSDRPSDVPSDRPSDIASDSPSEFPSDIFSDIPTIPLSTAPIEDPTASPTISPTSSTSLDCYTFTYILENTTGFDAESITMAYGNGIRDALEAATRTITIQIFNETYPRLNARHRYFPWRRLKDDNLHRRNSIRKAHYVPTDEALQHAIELGYGNDEVDISTSSNELAKVFNDIRQSMDRESKQHHFQQRELHQERSVQRRLVYYTDEYPVQITRVLDFPFCAPDRQGGDCAIVVTEVCYLLERGDDPDEVKNVLKEGFRTAIDNGDFAAAIPDESVMLAPNS